MRNFSWSIVVILFLFNCSDLSSGQEVAGFTEPYRSIDVAAPEMGIISEIFVEEGQQVAIGQVLARLNDDVLQASLAMAREGQTAKGRLNTAIAELNMHEEKWQKLMGLHQRRHASQTEIDRAKSQVVMAKARLETVNDDLRIKSLEQARIETQIQRQKLRSPIHGWVTRIIKDEGEFVSANDPIVAQVVQLDPLLTIFSVPQFEAEKILAGQTLSLRIGAKKEDTSGFVEFVSPTADAQSGTVRVKVRISNPGFKWRSGSACFLNTKDTGRLNQSSPHSDQVVGQPASRLRPLSPRSKPVSVQATRN